MQDIRSVYDPPPIPDAKTVLSRKGGTRYFEQEKEVFDEEGNIKSTIL